jgi:AcrR family transcriptional regulator
MSEAKIKILKVASELFAKKGYDAVSVREIANLAEVNLSMISYYFGGKEGLYKSIIETHYDKAKDLFSKLETLAQEATTNKANFIKFWRNFLEQLVELKLQNQNVEEILLHDFVQGLSYSYEIHKKYLPVMFKDLEKIIEVGKSKRWFKKEVDTFVFLSMLVSGIDMFLVMARKRCPFQRMAKSFIQERESWINQMMLIYFKGVES